jgi:hypothetical protein
VDDNGSDAPCLIRFGSADDEFGATGGLMAALSMLVVRVSVAVLQWAAVTFLPTPSRPHYQFSLSDVARVVQGILRSDESCSFVQGSIWFD